MTAIYRQVYEDIRRAVQRGEITGKLPSETEIARQYGTVSRQTIRIGLELLRAEGLIEAVHGKGWYVTGAGDHRPVLIRLREMIASKPFGPGDTLPGEHLLATELGVSRPTIRNALVHLEAQGLISTATPKGRTVLAPPTDKE